MPEQTASAPAQFSTQPFSIDSPDVRSAVANHLTTHGMETEQAISTANAISPALGYVMENPQHAAQHLNFHDDGGVSIGAPIAGSSIKSVSLDSVTAVHKDGMPSEGIRAIRENVSDAKGMSNLDVLSSYGHDVATSVGSAGYPHNEVSSLKASLEPHAVAAGAAPGAVTDSHALQALGDIARGKDSVAFDMPNANGEPLHVTAPSAVVAEQANLLGPMSYSPATKGVGEQIQDGLHESGQKLAQGAESTWEAFKHGAENIEHRVEQAFENLGHGIQTAAADVKEFLSHPADTVAAGATHLKDSIEHGVETAAADVKSFFSHPGDSIADGAASVRDSVEHKVETATDSTKSFLSHPGDSIADGAASLRDTVEHKFETAADNVKGFFSHPGDSVADSAASARDSVEHKVESAADNVKSFFSHPGESIADAAASVRDKVEHGFDNMTAKLSGSAAYPEVQAWKASDSPAAAFGTPESPGPAVEGAKPAPESHSQSQGHPAIMDDGPSMSMG